MRSSILPATPASLPVLAGDRRPLIAHVAAQQAAVGGQPARHAQRRVAGERADLDGAAGSHQRREHGHERTLLGCDLHPGDATEGVRLLDQVAQHGVGPGAVGNEVVVDLRGQPERSRVSHAGTVSIRQTASMETLYERVGGSAFFERLVDRFYDGVATDPELLALYPDADDLRGPRRRLTLFLIQYWGGPTTYSDERGHPRLRLRHAPFAIDSAAQTVGSHTCGPHWSKRSTRDSRPKRRTSCGATSSPSPTACATAPARSERLGGSG